MRTDYKYYRLQGGRKPYIIWVAGVLLALAPYALRCWICSQRGHKWVEEGSWGPDRGISTMTCKRCGESHRHVWY